MPSKPEKMERTKPGYRLVAIGGGTGLSTLLRGLKRHTILPGEMPTRDPFISDLTAVVTVSDDGGSSGRLRRELNILPPGDIRNCLVAVSEDVLPASCTIPRTSNSMPPKLWIPIGRAAKSLPLPPCQESDNKAL